MKKSQLKQLIKNCLMELNPSEMPPNDKEPIVGSPDFGSKLKYGRVGTLDPDPTTGGGFNAGNGFQTNCWECDTTELEKMVSEIIKEVMSEKRANTNPFDEFARRMKDHDWYGYMSDSYATVQNSERDFKELVEMATELAKVDPEKVIAIWKSTPDATKESGSDYIKSLFQQFRSSKLGSQPLKERLKAALRPLVLEAHRSIHAEPTVKLVSTKP